MSMNRVILIGRLGADPELKYTSGGTSVCELSIATTRVWYDKARQRQEETEWSRVTCWGRHAEIAAQYLSKGREVCVEGRLKTDTYEKDGVKRWVTKVVCESLVLLAGGGKGGGGQRDEGYDGGQSGDLAPAIGDDQIPF